MAIIDCDTPYPIRGTGRVTYSFSDTAAQAIANAVAMVDAEALNLARGEALNHTCRVECAHLSVQATATITNRYATWGQVSDLIASLFYGEWKYSGHVEFAWSGSITCGQGPYVGTEPPPRPLHIDPEPPLPEIEFKMSSAAVRITDAFGAPAPGVAVRFRVVSGPLRLAGSREVEVATNRDGVARADGSFLEPGAAVIAAMLSDQPERTVFLDQVSPGSTHGLHLSAPATTRAGTDLIVRAFATDPLGAPVTGATLQLALVPVRCAENGFDPVPMTAEGDGSYSGTVPVRRSGAHLVQIEDQVTHATASATVVVEAAAAHAIRIVGNADPRAARPFDVAVVRARLEDALGNAIDPGRLLCTVSPLASVTRTLLDGEARFAIRHRGSGIITATIRDETGNLSAAVAVDFSSTWLELPPSVPQASQYATPVYLAFPLDREVTRASVRVQYDSARVRYDGFQPAAALPGTVTVETSPDNVSLQWNDERGGHPAAEVGNGLWLGDARWSCLGSGTTCFISSAVMSPETAERGDCLEQKARRPPECVCVNLIYPHPSSIADPDLLRRALDRIERRVQRFAAIVNLNVLRCCSWTTVMVHRTELTRDQTDDIVSKVGAGGIGSDITSRYFSNPLSAPARLAIEHGIREHCVNLYLWKYRSSAPTRERADTHIGPTDGHATGAAGRGVIDLNVAANDANSVAHEIGHALGLNHDSAEGERLNLMWEDNTRGANLTAGQCATIRANTGNYPCTS